MKWNDSVKLTRIIYVGIFLFFLMCNILTPMIADDFSYSFICKTPERIKSLRDIFVSLKIHANSVNGRLVAHFFSYLFLMLPSWIFNIVNSIMFTLQVAFVYKISKGDGRDNNLLLIGIFCLLWMCVPVFGQVYLWLDGSSNYLWSIVFGLIFLMPYFYDYYFDKEIQTLVFSFVHVLFGFIAGAYLENTSLAVIFMAIILLGLCKFYQHKKIKIQFVMAIITACIGYISIYLSPAQWNNKSDGFTLIALRTRFVNALDVYKQLTIPLMVFVVLFVLAITSRVEKKRILLALVFLAGSICSNFMMILARYYPERCALAPTVFLIIALGILFVGVFDGQYKIMLTCVVSILMLSTSFEILKGVNDIYETYCYIKGNEEYIYKCKADGISDIQIEWYSAKTKYSGMYGLWYLSPEPGKDQWPNCDVADYYGIDSIVIRSGN